MYSAFLGVFLGCPAFIVFLLIAFVKWNGMFIILAVDVFDLITSKNSDVDIFND